MMSDVQTLFEAAGGAAGLRALAEAWHGRVMSDEVVSHAFSHGFHPDHRERLAAYWGQALGGPTTYTDRYGGQSSVARMHSGNGPHGDLDRRAIACFARATTDLGLRDPVRTVLIDYFTWATSSLGHYERSADDVPDGLTLPRWSWDGLLP